MSKILETHDNKDRTFWSFLFRLYVLKSLLFSTFNTDKIFLTKKDKIRDELYRHYSKQFKAQSIYILDPHEFQIETECLELFNKQMILHENTETMNVMKIKRHISKLKQRKSSRFEAVFNFISKEIWSSNINSLAN